MNTEIMWHIKPPFKAQVTSILERGLTDIGENGNIEHFVLICLLHSGFKRLKTSLTLLLVVKHSVP